MSASLRSALEDELAASPDDLATHAAYADLLEEMDDPRGELIQVQIALEDPSLDAAQRDQLARRQRELWRDHSDRLLGSLAPHLTDPGTSYEVCRGWLQVLRVGNLTLPLARALRDSPEARLLRELRVVSAYDADTEALPDDNLPTDDEDERGFWPLVGSRALANVRYLCLGIEEPDGPNFESGLHATAVVPLVRSMPRLQELHVYSRSNCLNHLFTLQTLRELRVLRLYHNSQVHRLDLLAANPAFRHLTHLLLHPHALAWHDNREEDEHAGFRREEGYLPLRVVESLVRSPNLSRLTHLQLRLSSMGDAGCRLLVESGILRRLKHLDLRHGRISDEGARALIECPDLRRLSWLDLAYNNLSEEMVARVQGLGIPGRVDAQHGADDEQSYVHEGDVE